MKIIEGKEVQDPIVTELYHLEPCGAKTPFKESLTSYISRLALAHSITVGTLINQIIGPELNLMYLLRSSRYGGSRFYDLGYEINGLGTLAEHISRVVSQLCGLSSAEELTLLSWRNVFPPRELLRQHKAWCPMCLDEWKGSGHDVYEPLIWFIKPVDMCTKHRVPLEVNCPNCKKTIPILSRKTQNGYCSFCGSWLGSTKHYHDASIKHIGGNIYSCNFSLSVENLLLLGIKEKASLLLVNNLIDNVGGLCSFCRSLGIPKATASSWKNEKSVPSLYTLLSICYILNLSLYKVINNSFKIKKLSKLSLTMKPQNKPANRQIDWNVVQEKIIDMTTNNDMPPSVREVAKHLGYDKRLLYKHFPELCKEISATHLSYVEKQKRKRISQGAHELVSVISVLSSNGITPSRRNIESLLPHNISLREECFKLIWKNS